MAEDEAEAGLSGDSAERYAELHRILGEVMALEAEQRDAYLLRACADDAKLEEEVRGLLRECSDELDDPFAESRVLEAREALDKLVDEPRPDWQPEKIGDYTILRKLGQGGMGVVYEAQQESPRRRVALKLLHPMQETRDRLKRFRQEAELLGRLQHPGIARIFEVGTYDLGRGAQPFFAMELIEGLDLRAHCKRHGLGRGERLELVAKIAEAIQHAHDHGIVHRDLKPENVIVDPLGAPRVLDFGIARAKSTSTDLSTIMTEAGQLVGTLAYMAPEQLSQAPDAITPAVDVYALGVMAFELLTERLPRLIQDLPLAEAIAALARNEPARAGDVDTNLRGDVDVILGKAMESEPARRYESAQAMAGDLRRYLDHHPILARAPSSIYLVRKFARRNKTLVGGVLATLLVAVVGAAIATDFAVEATVRAKELERSGYLASISAAQGAIEQGDFLMAEALLEKTPAQHRGWEFEHLSTRLTQDRRIWELPAPIISPPAVDPRGRRFLACMDDGRVGSWDLASGDLLESWDLTELVPDGSWLFDSIIIHGPSATYATFTRNNDLHIGRLREGGQLEELPSPEGEATRLHAWSRDGTKLLYRGDGVFVWDGTSSRAITSEPAAYGAFSRAGDRILLGLSTRLMLHDATSGERLTERKVGDVVSDLEYGLHDRHIAFGGRHRTVALLDPATLETERVFVGHQDVITNLEWSSDGERLVSASLDGMARVWSLDETVDPLVLNMGLSEYPLVAFLPDGRKVVVGGEGLHCIPLTPDSVLDAPQGLVHRLAFSPDGRHLAASLYRRPQVYLWELGPTRLVHTFEGPQVTPNPATEFENVPFLAFSADSRRLVAGTSAQTRQWRLSTGEELEVAEGATPFEQFRETLGQVDRLKTIAPHLDTDPDGRFFAVGMPTGAVDLFDGRGYALREYVQSGEPGHRGAGVLKVGSTPVKSFEGHVGGIGSVEFSPDGSLLASGGGDGTVRLWDVRSGEQLLVMRGHLQYIHDLEFSPDGSLLASASGDGTVRLWDTKSPLQRELLAAR